MISTLTVQTQAAGSLVGHWKFDEGSGTIAADSSGNGNTGTLNGPTWVDGKYGKALSFNGVNNYVRVEASSSLDVTTQVTVEAWVYPRAYVDSVGTDTHIISRCDSSGGAIYILGTFSNGKVGFAVNPTPNAGSSASTLQLNTWTHLAMTYDGAYVRLYINGVLDASYAQSGPIQTTSNWLAFGCKPTGPWGGAGTYAYFNGIIDDARIYNGARNQTEIQADMGVPRVATLSLTPNSGFAATTLTGSGFASTSSVTVTWDNTQIPTVPNTLITDANGNFTALISVLTQTTPGDHTVKAIDKAGNEASAIFTLINMTGSQGSQGQKGETGLQGPSGESGQPQLVLIAVPTALSLIAVCLATIALLRKKP